MSSPHIPISPYWDSFPKHGKGYSPLEAKEHLKFDVVVIGAGFTGLTAAMELRAAGKSVAVLDMAHVGEGETGLSTAQMTELIDTRYADLITKFGKDNAALAARASRDATDWVERHVDDIDCRFARVPGFLFAENTAGDRELDRECLAALQASVSIHRVTEGLPPELKATSAMRVDGQAQLDPRQYVLGLAKRLAASGVAIYERTRVASIEDGTPCTVKTTTGAVLNANDVVVATHTPICNMLFLHTKLAAYRSYVVATRLEKAFPAGLYFDLADPYHYIRTDKDKSGNPMLIVGGEDHKTGEDEDPQPRYRHLEKYVRERFGVKGDFDFHWSGQVLKPIDGLPYIGRNSASDHLYVGTGYNGNGTTFGTLAGLIVSDLILGRSSPYSELFAATRISPIAGAKEFVVENADALVHFVGDRFQDICRSVDEVPEGEGRIVDLHGTRAAVFRSKSGAVNAVSPVCTHVGCIVHWNNSEKTWDCPCHGARYDTKGKVLCGPALKDLAAIEVKHGEPVAVS